VLAPIRVGADASDVVLAGGALWVASSADSRVYRIDSAGATALRLGRMPVALASDGRRVMVADAEAGTVTAIDVRTRRPAAPVRVGGAPVDVALAGETTWLADAAGGRIVAVRGSAVADSVAVGRRPVALEAAGEDVYVLAGDDLVRVRDGEVRSRRPVGAGATALAVDRRFVWVAVGDNVLRFDR
jgi:YVTN family beta-propeller protein